MEVGDFTSTVACFMRLTWAAAAGRLDLVGSPQPIRETHGSLLPQGVRTRVSSTGDGFTLLSLFSAVTAKRGVNAVMILNVQLVFIPKQAFKLQTKEAKVKPRF